MCAGPHLRQALEQRAVHVAAGAGMPAVTRVLIVDDDEPFRRVLATALRHSGYEVLEASNPTGAQSHLANAHLVVSDVDMPEVSGLDLLEWWRDQDSLTPFVMVTAFGSDDVRARAQRLGAVAVLDKPFEIDELEHIIRAAVGDAGDDRL